MAQTTARESLTCAAFSYFAGGNTDLQEFSNIIYDYYFNDNETEIKKLSNNLPNSFNFNRMREEYKTKDNALVIDKKYPISQHKKDFPNGTLVKSETGEPTKLDGEICISYCKKIKRI
jgi:hypothetical protein